jgi:hypothetical protein
MRARNHNSAYFISGCLTGSAVTATLVFFVWLQTRPATPPPEVVAEAEPAPTAAAAPEAEAKCPGYTLVAPDWLPAAEGNNAKITRLKIPRSLRKRVAFWKSVWGKRPNHAIGSLRPRKKSSRSCASSDAGHAGHS